MAETPNGYSGRKTIILLVLVAAIPLSVFDQPTGFPLQEYDKYLHLTAFVFVTMIGAWAYPITPLWLLFVPLLALGAVTELLQAIPGIRREADWTDFAFNFIAIIVTLTVIAALRWLFRHHVPTEAPPPSP